MCVSALATEFSQPTSDRLTEHNFNLTDLCCPPPPPLMVHLLSDPFCGITTVKCQTSTRLRKAHRSAQSFQGCSGQSNQSRV